jgi:LDH2 family malate/lactate/ureidoglycolate dehydrogenase
MYVHELRAGDVDPKATPAILTETTAVACVDGNNGHGMVVGRYCMELAIRKAAEVGVGWVVARSSNHFGITGYYAMMAADHGMIGLSFTRPGGWMLPANLLQTLQRFLTVGRYSPSVEARRQLVTRAMV